MLIRFQISGCLVGRQTSSCCCLWKQNTLSRSSIRANRLTVPSRPFLGSTMPHRRGPVEQESLTCRLWPFDLAWGTGSIDSQSLASNLFAFSIVPYSGFLFHLTRSKKAPPLMLFGWYFLLVFVFATIPAGIYAKTQLGSSLANVDWLHGPAESLLTITNLLIVLGLRQGIREAEEQKKAKSLVLDVDTGEEQSKPEQFEAVGKE